MAKAMSRKNHPGERRNFQPFLNNRRNEIACRRIDDEIEEARKAVVEAAKETVTTTPPIESKTGFYRATIEAFKE